MRAPIDMFDELLTGRKHLNGTWHALSNTLHHTTQHNEANMVGIKAEDSGLATLIEECSFGGEYITADESEIMAWGEMVGVDVVVTWPGDEIEG